jgi:hypothetical protein
MALLRLHFASLLCIASPKDDSNAKDEPKEVKEKEDKYLFARSYHPDAVLTNLFFGERHNDVVLLQSFFFFNDPLSDLKFIAGCRHFLNGCSVI